MKNFSVFLLCLIINFSVSAADEPAFERIMRTNTIRCGYIIYPPQLIKDVATDEISGFAHDIIEYIAGELNLKVEWVEETGTASMIESLKNGRFDLLCNPVWTSTPRAREAYFTTPVFFTAVHAYARVEDTRFDQNIEKLNNSEYKIAVMDGSSSPVIAATDFPKAQTVSLMELTDFTHLLLEVSTGKADVTFSEKAQAEDFLKMNPNSIRRIPLKRPVRLFGNAYMMARGENDLQNMLNTALFNAQNNGAIDRILDEYEHYPNSYYRLSVPYAPEK